MKIHPIETPYTDDEEKFYVSLPEEFPAEKTVECPSTGNPILVEYEDSDEEDVAFEVFIDKADEFIEDDEEESPDDEVGTPEEIFNE